MIREAIVLAGGLGTRLGNLTKDIPKPMMEVNGRPFLEYIMNFLIFQKIERIILSVGYRYEKIEEYFGSYYEGLNIKYVIEKNRLGTGGAIVKSMQLVEEDVFLVLNGDTFFNISFSSLESFHKSRNSQITLSLKKMEKVKRYGFVNIDESGRVKGFIEKTQNRNGFINGGVYVINKDFLSNLTFPEQFSFEKDFIGKTFDTYAFFALAFDEYFIDIGIPEDLDRAKRDFALIFPPSYYS